MQKSTSVSPPQPAANPLLRNAVRTALTGAMITGAVAAAQAQTGPPTTSPTADTSLQEVVVTGSRIKQPALEAVSPVTTVTNVEIQQTGATRIEDLLNQLPQVTGDMGSSLSNGATGESTISLRGLGAQRTLVLVNGRRLMPGDPTQNGNSAPDLNQIPAALVDRVDLLTGGAASTYGADAVAGVVNFVMNDHFEGVKIDATGSMLNHHNHDGDMQGLEAKSGFTVPTGTTNDGQGKDINVILGSNFADGRGNATVYMGYRRTNAVLQGNRDYSACSLSTSSGFARTCGGSVTANPAFFNLKTLGYTTIGAGNTLVPATFPASLYNYAPLNYYQRPEERYTGGAFAHYDITDHTTAYVEFMFMDDRTQAQVAPSGAFYGSGTGVTNGVPDATWVVNCANPYLSASELAGFCGGSTAGDAHLTFGRRDVEGGNRVDDLGHTSFRTVVGLKGDLNDAWSYDTYFQNGITRFQEEYLNDVSKSRMANALMAVREPDGTVVCAANAGGANGAPGCVPWDIFQLGGVTKAQTDYLVVPGLSRGYTQEDVFEATLTGDLGKQGIKLPTANNGLGVSFGTQWRQEKASYEPDEEYITNDLAGQGAPSLPTYGSYNVWEVYSEARLPIFEDQPFAKSLSAEAGYRYSDYNLAFGSTNTFKAGLEWAPVSDVRVRGMYQRAVRAPNIQELYLQERVQLDSAISNDPCSGATPAATLAQCALTGVTAAEYGHISSNPSHQYNGLQGGNPNLNPETADTVTLGFVFTPTFLPTFNSTIDFYNIKIKNVISTYGAGLVLQNCLSTADPFYCNKVVRAPATGSAADGSLWIGTEGYVQDGTYNLGQQTARGVDLTMDYLLDIGPAGRLAFNFNGTYALKLETQPVPGGGTYDCAGYYGPTCGAPNPHIKGKLRTTWNTPFTGLDVWAAYRMIGPVKIDTLSQNPLLAGTVSPFTDVGNVIPGYNYIDLGASFQVNKVLTVRAGVNNVLDKDPPTLSLAYLPGVLGNGNTFPQVYDSMGRYMFVNVTLNF